MQFAVNPRIGVDAEIAEWAKSDFWSRVRFLERLTVIQVYLSAKIAVYEWDRTGATRKAHALTQEHRDQCDQRGPEGPIRRRLDRR